MDTLNTMNKEAEATANFLQQQLAILQALADKQRQERERAEIERLRGENQMLRSNLQNIRDTLTYWETINGVKQIPIPVQAAKTPSTDVQVKQEPTPVVAAPKENKKDAKKDKKSEKQPKQENKPNKGAAPAEDKPIDVSRLKMRVGKIVNVKKHPDADGLFVEEVDVGEQQPRTIISGLVKHYELEQMQGRMAVFLVNLKPAKMRGIMSQGMIMCASTPDKVEILEVPQGAQIGDTVYCEGFQGEPDLPQMNPKKKIWEQVQPDLHVNASGVATYKGGAFTIASKGQCKAPTMRDCPIK